MALTVSTHFAEPAKNIQLHLITSNLPVQNLYWKSKCQQPKLTESELVNTFASSNSSKIYSYIRSLSRSHTLPQTMRLNSSASTDSEKATLFNHYFHSVFTSSSYILPPVFSLPEPSSSLNDLHITESDTFKALNSIDPSKAPGSDSVGPNLLKHCAIALYGPLHHLFTQCLIQHNIPSEWQIHQITPIHKSG